MRMAVRGSFENHMGDQILVCGLSGLNLEATLGKLSTAAVLVVPRAWEAGVLLATAEPVTENSRYFSSKSCCEVRAL